MPHIINGSGPFALWDRPAAYPQADLVSGVPDSPVFDLGIDLDNKDGVAYIRADHVTAMARTLGMLPEDEANELKAENERLKFALANPESEIGRLANAVSELDSLVRSVLSNPSSAGVPVEDSGETKPAELGYSKASGNKSKSPVVKGPDDIPESTDDANTDIFGLGDSPVKSD